MMAFCCTETELALKKRFEGVYERTQTPIMQAIERQVCGCDFCGNSWTHKEQADALIPLLGFGPNSDLVDLGAGTGWPGISSPRPVVAWLRWLICPKPAAAQAELSKLLGTEEARARLAKWRSKLRAIEDGLFVRELFVSRPM